jgi:cell division protein FtsB
LFSPYFLQQTAIMNRTRLLFWILSLLVLGLFIRLWVGQGSYQDLWNLQEQIDSHNLANDQQAEINRKLQVDVAALKKDDTAVESHARSELGMTKEGETFYQVILKSDPQAPTNVPSPAQEAAHVE